MNGCTAARPSIGPSGGGALARVGRAKLRADLTTPTEPAPGAACDCPKCCPPPLTDIEAQQALRHVSNRDAAAYGRGELSVVSMYGCEDCGAWVPTFTDTAR
ncbi:hypothetical protein EUA04_13305 [Mycolicibacterium obuense]|uniref:Uncharacterized protein n=1 Tax=Mycolicibacterium obuense TaxID=1807 RepID=A0A0M2JWW4_9MYCO|nr:hypothetical protein [Mycolicibacterium obuense]KKF01579.1 hypothetical protein WN67_12690 [Mycolicibacterium obuense]TDL08689.1 hypothetical protein EUA04_13305 [Mycolicibacterium obuense]